MFWSSCNKRISRLTMPILVAVSLLMSAIATAGEPADAVDTKSGQAIYSQTCIACHGADGKGVLPGVSDFTAVDGPLSKSDAELATSINDGLATPGAILSMPAKGGNPTLSDEDVRALVAYLRSRYGQ